MLSKMKKIEEGNKNLKKKENKLLRKAYDMLISYTESL